MSEKICALVFKVFIPLAAISFMVLLCFPVCNRPEGFNYFLFWILVLLRHYLEVAGYEVIIDEEELIGVPLVNYIREKNAVIEFSKPLYNTKVGYRREYAKTQLCRRAKIKMIRILKPKDKEFEDCVNITRLDNSDEALTEAIKLALKILKINLDTGLEVHREYLFQQYINGSDQVAE